MKIDIEWRAEFLQGFTPTDYDGDETFLRLPNDVRIALLHLLGHMSRNDLKSFGLNDDEADRINRIYHSLY